MTTIQPPSSEQVAAAWATVKSQLESGTRELVLSFDDENSLGEVAMQKVLTLFETSINAKGSILRDSEHNVIRILPPPATAVKKPALLPSRVARNGRAKVAKDRMSKVPRPPNAFILYRQHFHPKLKAQHPDMHNNEISIKLGQQWQEEDPSTKQHYKDKAEEIKKKHNEQHPTYQYQPRRASEKKRRMTKAKAAMSNTSDSPSKSPPDIAHVNAPTARAPRPTGRELGMYIPQSSLAATFAGTNGNGPLNTNPTSPGFRLLASGSRLTYDHQAANGAAILNMNFSEDAADEAVYDDAFMDWPQWTADADQVRQQTMEDFHNYEANFAPQYNSDLAGYGAPLRSWHQHTADAYLRHGRLHTEFQDRPRSLWNIATTSVPNASEPQTMAPPPTQDYQDPSMYTTADLTALTAQGSAVQSSHMPATETFHRQEPQALDTDLPSQYMNGENLQQYDGFMPADDGFFSSLDNFNSNIDDEGFMLRLNSEP